MFQSSYLWAIILTAVIAGWLYSGDVIIGGQGAPEPSDVTAESAVTAPANPADKPVRVRVTKISALEREASLSVRGRTQAEQRVDVRAQTAGLIEELAVEKGDVVKTGDVICRIEAAARRTKVAQAEAQLALATLNYEASDKLSTKGYAAETKLRSDRALMNAAEAALFEAKLDLTRTVIRAPFDGTVEELQAELGALLNVGDPCARLVARDPMLVVAQVAEREVGNLSVGMPGRAILVTGEKVDGTIGYISPSASEATRTFRVELEIPNQDGALRDGVTSEIQVGLETVQAHRFSPALLTLNDAGDIGVRVVDDENIARFIPVQILGDGRDGIWVAGLPETVTIITVGQEYVVDGQPVDPVIETAEASQ